MHIRRITIENVRRFGAGTAGVELSLPSHGWIVVAGRNGSGKTTFLQVLALALAGNFVHEYTDTLFAWLRQGTTHGRSRVHIVPSREDAFRDGVEIISAQTAGEDLLVGDDWKPVHGAMSHGGESDGNRALAGPWHLEPKGWFAVGYGSHRRLFGQASVSDGWSSETTREGAFLTLFRDDAALVHPIRWLMDLHYRGLDGRNPEDADATRIVRDILSLLNDGLLGDTKVLDVSPRGLTVEQGGQKFTIKDLGAGAQVLTALVVDMLRHMHARFGTLRFAMTDGAPVVDHDGVVLIDEVDAHLHVSWQQRVGPWFKRHFPRVQFIVTTHSPFICQSADEGGLIILPAQGSTETVRVADGDLYHRVVNGSVDDALISELFGLEHTWSDDAEAKRDRLAALEAKVLTKKVSADERREYQRLLSEVPQTMSGEVERASAQLALSLAAHAKQ